MITSIVGVIAIILFITCVVAAIEYRDQYYARIDRYKVEEEFVQEYLETQEALKLCTYVEGGRVIEAFDKRWREVMTTERVDYFVQQMHKSLDLRILYQINAN